MFKTQGHSQAWNKSFLLDSIVGPLNHSVACQYRPELNVHSSAPFGMLLRTLSHAITGQCRLGVDGHANSGQ